MSDAPNFEAEEKPVLIFGARQAPMEQPAPGPYSLSRAVTPEGGLNMSPTGRLRRRTFFVDKADPVTTRVLQLWRPQKHESLVKWLDEFSKLRPLAPLLCWLVCMRAIHVEDVLNALGEYGWDGAPGQIVHHSAAPARIRLADVAGDLVEFRRRVEWALEVCESEYGLEYLNRDDASLLLSACEAALEAEQAEQAAKAAS